MSIERGWHSFLADTLRILSRAYRADTAEDAAQRMWFEALWLDERLDDKDAVAELSGASQRAMHHRLAGLTREPGASAVRDADPRTPGQGWCSGPI
ncbi:hypothetical protein ACGFNU_37330 [Spirillospora sp. NPDC048911]|uniref:hypothetical protein n=1 Tax=Spirillospora sp. NPDC048911 TaxID=3364527 RepID=UPI00371502DC